MFANIAMGLGITIFCVAAVWSAAMAGPDNPDKSTSGPTTPTGPTFNDQHGGQTGGVIHNNGPVYNAPEQA